MCDTTRNPAPGNAQSAHPQCIVAAVGHAARHAASAVHGAPARLCIWSGRQRGPRSHHRHQRFCLPRHQCACGCNKVPMLEALHHQQVASAQKFDCILLTCTKSVAPLLKAWLHGMMAQIALSRTPHQCSPSSLGAPCWERRRHWYLPSAHRLWSAVASRLQPLLASFYASLDRPAVAVMRQHSVSGRLLLPGAAMFEACHAAAAALLGSLTDLRFGHA